MLRNSRKADYPKTHPESPKIRLTNLFLGRSRDQKRTLFKKIGPPCDKNKKKGEEGIKRNTYTNCEGTKDLKYRELQLLTEELEIRNSCRNLLFLVRPQEIPVGNIKPLLDLKKRK